MRVDLSESGMAGLKTGPQMHGLLTKVAVRVERTAKRLAPVDTGLLRGSIGHDIAHDQDGLTAKVGSFVEYSLFQELGTYKMRAHPFLRPALEAAAEGVA